METWCENWKHFLSLTLLTLKARRSVSSLQQLIQLKLKLKTSLQFEQTKLFWSLNLVCTDDSDQSEWKWLGFSSVWNISSVFPWKHFTALRVCFGPAASTTMLAAASEDIQLCESSEKSTVVHDHFKPSDRPALILIITLLKWCCEPQRRDFYYVQIKIYIKKWDYIYLTDHENVTVDFSCW